MKLDYIRDYLTLEEVQARWKATEADMRRAILKGVLRPSLYLDTVLPAASLVEGEGLVLISGERRSVRGWHYSQFMKQIGALGGVFHAVSVLPECMAGSEVLALHEPIPMELLLVEGVVMADDLLRAEEQMQAETCWQQRSAKTKEFNSVLNILSIALADCYRYDPRTRSSTARQIQEAGEQFGIPISEGTITKWIREAVSQYPPAYMAQNPEEPALEEVPAT